MGFGKPKREKGVRPAYCFSWEGHIDFPSNFKWPDVIVLIIFYQYFNLFHGSQVKTQLDFSVLGKQNL